MCVLTVASALLVSAAVAIMTGTVSRTTTLDVGVIAWSEHEESCSPRYLPPA
jgi:hypothetical protein